jgi:ribosomal protein L24
MLQFKNYIENKENLYDFENLILEFMDSENFVPKNGIWAKSNGGWSYYFDVEGDNCEDLHSGSGSEYKGRCYQLNLSGDPNRSTSISFYRGGSVSDSGRGVQINLTKTILRAISEFIEKKKPRYFSWSPVLKTKVNPVLRRIINQDARGKLYDKFFVDKYFPEYVPIGPKHWTSRENYEKFYVPYGYSPIPENITKNSQRSEKMQVIENLENFKLGNAGEINRRNYERSDAEYRDEMEQARKKQREQEEKVQKVLNDPQQNPDQIKISDLVDVKHSENIGGNETESYTVGIVKEFLMSSPEGPNLSDEKLSAIVKLSDDDGESFYGPSKTIPLSELKKETPDSKQEREEKNRRKLEILLRNPELNPNKISENDQILIFMPRNPTANGNGLMGTVEKIVFKKDYSQGELYAKIKWDESTIEKMRSMDAYRSPSDLVTLKYLIKNTPDAQREIERKKREIEIENQISRRQRLHSRRSRHDQDMAERLTQTPEEIERLTNHPSNPNRIKPNDFVKITAGYNRNKKGTVISVRSYAYDENRLVVSVKLHRSYRIVSEPLYNIEKDMSENAVRIQNRQRRRQEIGSMSRGFQIGDMVRVTSGRYRDKTGRILSFRLVNNVLSAVLTPLEGRNFSVKIDFIERTNSHGLPEANLNFKQYVSIVESV